MESTKNARGNSKDPSSSTTNGNSAGDSKKKAQPALTQFFKKQGPVTPVANKQGGGASSAMAHSSANLNGATSSQSGADHVQTRQSAQLSQNRESSSNGRTATDGVAGSKTSNSTLQTPHKKQSALDSPSKKRGVSSGVLPDEQSLQEIQQLVDKKVGANAMRDSQSQPGFEDSAVKRSLRPVRQVNYKQMLEGDETTLKSIQDEQAELKKKKREARLAAEGNLDYNDDLEDEDMLMDDAQIERASDDEDDEDYPAAASSKRSARKRTRREVADEDEEPLELDNNIADESEDEEADEEDANLEDEDLDNESYVEGRTNANKRKQKIKAKKSAIDKKKRKTTDGTVDKDDGAAIGEEETVFIDNLPNDEFEIRRMLKEVKKHIKLLEKQFFEEEDSEKEEELKMINNNSKHEEALEAFKLTSHLKQFWCIPLSVNVKTLDFDLLAKSQIKHGGRLFDVITIDPPWQLSSANPTRGVAIAYDTLNDKEILNMPFEKLQTDGFIFIWVINAKYRFALEMMEKFGYKLVDEIAWVKQTVNGKIAKGHGYYLQHAKETCLVGVKGNVKGKARFNIESDVIFSQRRGQSQKPEEIYEIAEALVPNGYYLEIFGRRNNLHNGWVTVGNEL